MIGMLLFLFGVAAVCFGLGLVALGQRDDLLAVLLCATGALSLRAMHLAARVGEGRS